MIAAALPLASLGLLLVATLATGAAAWRAERRGARGTRGVAALGGAVTLAGFALAAWAPWPAPLRTCALVFAATVLAKTAALGRGRPCRSRGVGVAFVLAYPGLDPARAFVRDPAPRRGAGLATFAAGGVETFLAFAVSTAAARLGLLDAGAYPAAWARTLALFCLLDGAFRTTRGLLASLGYRAERLSNAPWAAADLADFWGRRWNLLVARTLAADVYAPVRRRAGRVAGALAAFLASGLFHEALFTLPAPHPIGAHTTFFLLHGVASVATSAIGPRWGATTHRVVAWTVFLASTPLFFGGPYPAAAPLEHLLGSAGTAGS